MKSSLVALAMCMGTALAAFAAPDALAQRVLPGYVSKDRVEKLSTEIHWYDNLKQALSEAEREGKLVFWVHMLGHIDGAT